MSAFHKVVNKYHSYDKLIQLNKLIDASGTCKNTIFFWKTVLERNDFHIAYDEWRNQEGINDIWMNHIKNLIDELMVGK